VPVGRIALVVGVIAAAALVATLVVLQIRSLAEQVVAAPTTSSSPSPVATAEPTVEPIIYPAVAGELGSRLGELQAAVADLGSDDATAALQALVLGLTELAAAGDLEGARAEVDAVQHAVDQAELSASEREAIKKAMEEVRKDLDELIKDENGKGKGNKPPKD
jgi:hypothetical protein